MNTHTTLTRWVSRLALLCFALQALVPNGYMPADLNSGWFLTLCPQGLPDHIMVAGHTDHHHMHHGRNDGDEFQSHCEFGCLLSDAVASGPAYPGKFAVAVEASATLTTSLISTDRRAQYRPRAPPTA